MRKDAAGQVDLRHAMEVLRRRWRWTVTPMVVGALVAPGAAMLQAPRYEATAILLAGQGDGIGDVTAIDAINKATQTLARMGTNRVVVEQALDDLGLSRRLRATDVAERTTSSVPANTQQIELTVEDADPARAAALANGIARTFSEMVEERAGDESRLSATLWQPAVEPADPSAPDTHLYAALGLVLGGLVGAALATLRHQTDRSWRDVEDLEEYTGIPVLASIPDAASAGRARRTYA